MDDLHTLPPSDPSSDPLDAAILKVMQHHAENPWPELGPVNGDTFWRSLQARLATERAPVIIRPSDRSRHLIALGAVCAGLAFAVFGLWKRNDAHHPTVAAMERFAAGQVYRTANGQRASIALPGGSHVVLGPASTLTLTQDFDRGAREVRLDGEGYFTVSPDSKRPFRVSAGNAVVRVLGTDFSVRRYANDGAVRVVVENGRVSLTSRRADARSGVILSSAMLGVAADSGGAIVTSAIALDDYRGWRDGRLVFRSVPLRDLMADLSRVYDVDLRTTDSTLAAQLVTVTVATATESLAEVLDGLMPPLNAHYTRSGRILTIRPGRATRAMPVRRSSFSSIETSYGK